MDRVFDSLNRCGKKVENATRKAEALANGVRNHLKFSPSIADAAMARLAQGTKLITEGHDRVFQQEFGILPGEKLLDSFVCYVSTTSGPVMGTIYVSDKRVSFCSDYPLRYPSPTSHHPPLAYYKVMLPMGEIRSISASANRGKPSERYVNVAMQDGYEFWFMGFVSHDKALKCLNHALQHLHRG